jgi:superoxide dismutase, Cu-Zn family
MVENRDFAILDEFSASEFIGVFVMAQQQMRRLWLAVVALSVCLVTMGWGLLGWAVDQPAAIANIQGPGISGRLDLRETKNGVLQVTLKVQGDPTILTQGLHGVHFHETGVCDGTTTPQFALAQGHFDPGPFGNTTPVEQNHPFHLGDLPNLSVNRKGQGYLQTVTTRSRLQGAANALLDADGAALIVHQNPDLQKAGGTAAESGGARLACGVIQSGKTLRHDPVNLMSFRHTGNLQPINHPLNHLLWYLGRARSIA